MRTLIINIALLLLAAPKALGQASLANPNAADRLRQQTGLEVRSKVQPLIDRYCGDACQIISVDVKLGEELPEAQDLGFETETTGVMAQTLFVEQVTVNVQIDRQVTTENREKLDRILLNHLQGLSVAARVNWVQLDSPRIGRSASSAENLRRRLGQEIEQRLQKVVQDYCPESCILGYIDVRGRPVNPDEAKTLPAREVVRSKSGNAFFALETVEVDLTMSAELGEAARERLLNLMKAQTRFVRPVRYRVNTAPFPQSFAAREAQRAQESADPYGLEKLRRMLTMFRDLAGTKEIINSSNTETQDNTTESSMWWAYLIAFLVVAVVIGLIFIRFANANRDARYLMNAAGQNPPKPEGEAPGEKKPENLQARINWRLRNQELKEELIKTFLEAPKVAKETFSRLLVEEGVEETAKYVHIFGQVIVFELLSDPNLARNLFDLSEFYHKSNFDFSAEEEYRLLQALKTRATANEIRVLSRKTIDQFDFLFKLDPAQTYNLIKDESAQVQSIVLTQVPVKNRRGVFQIFEGQDRIELLSELSKADTIPKEYLLNVAQALAKKVMSKPEFDTQNLRSSDILLDLLERSSLEDQRVLMASLVENNPDAARAIKMKLVTIEMLPYLKVGHLLELILGLERENLLTFLMGTPDHVQRLLLSHAPQELAESWSEDMDNMGSVEESNYQIVEAMILGKVRQLASAGAVNILDVNELIFQGIGQDAGPQDDDNDLAVDHVVA